MALWKVSHGRVRFWNAERLKAYLDPPRIAIYGATGPVGQHRKGQGKAFKNEMKVDDLFYLCYAHEIRLIGRVATKAVPSKGSRARGWFERSYDIIAKAKPHSKYRGKKHVWTPNGYSTCVAICADDFAAFNSCVLKPFFPDVRGLEARCNEACLADDDTDDDERTFPEGRRKFKLHTARERSQALRHAAIDQAMKRFGKLACRACGFVFEDRYGPVGKIH